MIVDILATESNLSAFALEKGEPINEETISNVAGSGYVICIFYDSCGSRL